MFEFLKGSRARDKGLMAVTLGDGGVPAAAEFSAELWARVDDIPGGLVCPVSNSWFNQYKGEVVNGARAGWLFYIRPLDDGTGTGARHRPKQTPHRCNHWDRPRKPHRRTYRHPCHQPAVCSQQPVSDRSDPSGQPLRYRRR